MKRKKNKVAFFSVLLVATLLLAAVGLFFRKEGNKKSISLEDYYKIKKDEAKLFIDGMESEERVKILDERVYFTLDYAKTFEKRLFFEPDNNIVIHTDAKTKTIYPIGKRMKVVNGEEAKMERPIFVFHHDEVLVEADFLKEFTDFEYKLFVNPNRVLLFRSDKSYEKVELKKDSIMRTAPDVEALILSELKKGEKFYVIEGGSNEDYEKVLSFDGILGFIEKKDMVSVESEKRTFKKVNENEGYTSLQMEEPIILGWHQVFTEKSNSGFLTLLSRTKGLNVISPTWFSIIREDGELSSLASESYVKEAHNRGIQVWALVNDFDKNVDFYQLFMREENRKRLIENLVYFIDEYDLDGINIDFEKIEASYAEGYVQFLREFSIVMRQKEKVFSIDNYVPAVHTDYYDRKEQGIVADYLCVMAYDEHYYGSPEPGSVSSLSWVRRGIDMTGEEVDKKKMIIGLPFYTRIWKVKEDGSIETKALSMAEGKKRVQTVGAKAVWDEVTGQNYAEWKQDGAQYKIWLEDENSVAAKMNEVIKEEVAGLAFWKLGLEEEAVWAEIESWRQN